MERRLELLEMEVLYRENDGLVFIFRHIDYHILVHISMNGNWSMHQEIHEFLFMACTSPKS